MDRSAERLKTIKERRRQNTGLKMSYPLTKLTLGVLGLTVMVLVSPSFLFFLMYLLAAAVIYGCWYAMNNRFLLNQIADYSGLLTEYGLPEEFLEETQPLAAKMTNPFMGRAVQMDIANAYALLGRFDVALAELEKVDPMGLPVPIRDTWYMNKLCYLLYTGQKGYADFFILNNSPVFHKRLRNSMLPDDLILRAVYEIYGKGKGAKGLEFLERLELAKLPSVSRAEADFLIGRAHELNNEGDKAMLHYASAALEGGNTWYAQQAREKHTQLQLA